MQRRRGIGPLQPSSLSSVLAVLVGAARSPVAIFFLLCPESLALLLGIVRDSLVVVPISEPSFEPARTLRLAVVCGDAASLLLFKTRPTPGDRYEGSLAQRQSAYARNSIDIVDGEDLDSDVGGDLCDFQ
jgi:hypothetical protein